MSKLFKNVLLDRQNCVLSLPNSVLQKLKADPLWLFGLHGIADSKSAWKPKTWTGSDLFRPAGESPEETAQL